MSDNAQVASAPFPTHIWLQLTEGRGAAHDVANELDVLAELLDLADMESTDDLDMLTRLCLDARCALLTLMDTLPETSDHKLLATSHAAILGATVQHSAEKIRKWAVLWRALTLIEPAAASSPTSLGTANACANPEAVGFVEAALNAPAAPDMSTTAEISPDDLAPHTTLSTSPHSHPSCGSEVVREPNLHQQQQELRNMKIMSDQNQTSLAPLPGLVDLLPGLVNLTTVAVTDSYELWVDGALVAWVTGIKTVEEAYTKLDRAAHLQVKLKVLRTRDGAEMPREGEVVHRSGATCAARAGFKGTSASSSDINRVTCGACLHLALGDAQEQVEALRARVADRERTPALIAKLEKIQSEAEASRGCDASTETIESPESAARGFFQAHEDMGSMLDRHAVVVQAIRVRTDCLLDLLKNWAVQRQGNRNLLVWIEAQRKANAGGGGSPRREHTQQETPEADSYELWVEGAVLAWGTNFRTVKDAYDLIDKDTLAPHGVKVYRKRDGAEMSRATACAGLTTAITSPQTPKLDVYELRSDGSSRAWVANIKTVREAYSLLDTYAESFGLKVRRSRDGVEMLRVDHTECDSVNCMEVRPTAITHKIRTLYRLDEGGQRDKTHTQANAVLDVVLKLITETPEGVEDVESFASNFAKTWDLEDAARTDLVLSLDGLNGEHTLARATLEDRLEQALARVAELERGQASSLAEPVVSSRCNVAGLCDHHRAGAPAADECGPHIQQETPSMTDKELVTIEGWMETLAMERNKLTVRIAELETELDRLNAKISDVVRLRARITELEAEGNSLHHQMTNARTMHATQQEFFERLVPHLAPHMMKDEKYIDGAIRLITNAVTDNHPAAPATPSTAPTLLVSEWKGPASRPLHDLHALQSEAPFRPAVFRMSPKTALMLLNHPSIWSFCRDHNCLAILETQSIAFRIPGIGEVRVVSDMPDGEVHYASISDAGTATVLARLKGAL